MRIEEPPRRRAALSLTPLIDVVFILLVFFMLVARFSDWTRLEVAVADGSSTSAGQRAVMQVTAVPNGYRWQAGGQVLALAEIVERVGQSDGAATPRAVTIDAADGVPLQQTVTLVSRLRESGIDNVTWSRP